MSISRINANIIQDPAPRLEAVQQRNIQASPECVWQFLTQPGLLSEWFADCRFLAPDSEFRFDFGDGDFFVGRVLSWFAPRHLKLRWKHNSIGVESDVTFDLTAEGNSSTVRLTDCGAACTESVQDLVEGWDDFLARLQRRIETGQRSRYLWSQSIGLGSRIIAKCREWVEIVRNPSWFQVTFPNASCRIARNDRGYTTIEFRDASFGSETTTALIKTRQFANCCHIGVSHSGWDKLHLPLVQQIELRRTYNSLWVAGLKKLEEDLLLSTSADILVSV